MPAMALRTLEPTDEETSTNPSAVPDWLRSCAQPGWRRTYLDWRVSVGGDLEAVANTVKSESIWLLIQDLLESAMQAGWERGEGLPAEFDRRP